MYLQVLKEILFHSKALQSDFCRYNAFVIAEMASRGHITSVLEGIPGNRWYVTGRGLRFLGENKVEVFGE